MLRGWTVESKRRAVYRGVHGVGWSGGYSGSGGGDGTPAVNDNGFGIDPWTTAAAASSILWRK
jgi:hypothetical protein